jgi:hypothetical protein
MSCVALRGVITWINTAEQIRHVRHLRDVPIANHLAARMVHGVRKPISDVILKIRIRDVTGSNCTMNEEKKTNRGCYHFHVQTFEICLIEVKT